jgi:hypothetical protein
VTAYGLLRRPRWTWLDWVTRATGHHWSWAATILLGFGLIAWIVLEIAYISDRSWLEGAYAAVGAALLLLAAIEPTRRYLAPRAHDHPSRGVEKSSS